LIGKQDTNVCTDESKFHLHLDNLGKTPRSAEEEKLLTWDTERPKLPKIRNPVFLFEINQTQDENQTRADLYRSDLQHFLGLKEGLEPIESPSKKKSSTKRDLACETKCIDICDDTYGSLRAELLKNAVEASMWIRRYFLQSPDVTVSSPEHFNELLEAWMVDPCVARNAADAASAAATKQLPQK